MASQQRKRRLGSGSDEGSAGEESERRQAAAAQPPAAKRTAAAAASGGAPARQQAAAAAEPAVAAPMSIEEIRKVRRSQVACVPASTCERTAPTGTVAVCCAFANHAAWPPLSLAEKVCAPDWQRRRQQARRGRSSTAGLCGLQGEMAG